MSGWILAAHLGTVLMTEKSTDFSNLPGLRGLEENLMGSRNHKFVEAHGRNAQFRRSLNSAFECVTSSSEGQETETKAVKFSLWEYVTFPFREHCLTGNKSTD